VDKEKELEVFAGEKKDGPWKERRRVCLQRRLHPQTYSIVLWLENSTCNPFEDENNPKRHI